MRTSAKARVSSDYFMYTGRLRVLCTRSIYHWWRTKAFLASIRRFGSSIVPVLHHMIKPFYCNNVDFPLDSFTILRTRRFPANQMCCMCPHRIVVGRPGKVDQLYQSSALRAAKSCHRNPENLVVFDCLRRGFHQPAHGPKLWSE